MKRGNEHINHRCEAEDKRRRVMKIVLLMLSLWRHCGGILLPGKPSAEPKVLRDGEQRQIYTCGQYAQGALP